MNNVEKRSVRKGEQGTLLEPCRLKDIRKGLQWTRSTCKHSGRTRCTRNDKDQLRHHFGWKWKAKNMNLAKRKHLDETPVRRGMIDTTLQLNKIEKE